MWDACEMHFMLWEYYTQIKLKCTIRNKQVLSCVCLKNRIIL